MNTLVNGKHEPLERAQGRMPDAEGGVIRERNSVYISTRKKSLQF
jgi:hypothetical protein